MHCRAGHISPDLSKLVPIACSGETIDWKGIRLADMDGQIYLSPPVSLYGHQCFELEGCL